MISRLEVVGLGPHKRSLIALNPTGVTTISGPSEVGKSTILEAILLTLLGRGLSGRFRSEHIHDTSDRAEIKLTLQDGRVLKRTITRSRSTSRHIIINGQRSAFTSEASYASELGALVADPEAAHVVMAPLAWQALIAANARPFRDLLTRAIPGVDPASEVETIMTEELGLAVSPEECAWSEKQAAAARREARRIRDQQTGAASAISEQVVQLQSQVTGITIPDTHEAQAVLDAASSWRRFDALSQQTALAADRARQRAALGPEPVLSDPLELALAAESQADADLQQITTAWRESRQRRDHIAEQLGGMDAENPDICPTCQRPDWEEGIAQLITLQARLSSAEASLKQAVTDGEQARERQGGSRQRVRAAQEAQARLDAWRQTLSALSAPAASTDPQPQPSVPRPDAAEHTAAQQAIQAAEQVRIIASQRKRDLVTLTARHSDLARQLDEATAETLRLEALLSAIRQAPSRLAERQSSVLGALGPVTLIFGEKPAVTMLIDGRPWWLASRGRQVVADIHLRAALRRAFGLDMLPIIVDNVQDVGGQPLPDVPGPLILLRTTDEAAISIQSGT
jgi:chromosome segregation ATPase